MEYKKLGTSDLMVSPVCVGCMSFGERFADFHEWTLNQQGTNAVVRTHSTCASTSSTRRIVMHNAA